MIFLSGLFLIIGILLEYYATYLLLSDVLFQSLIYHLLACVCLVLCTKAFVMTFFKQVYWPVYAFILLLSLFIPIWGMLISIFWVLDIYRLHLKFYKRSELFDSSINLMHLKPVHLKYGAGGVIVHLMRKNASTTSRTQALFVLGQSRFSFINQFMFDLLSDNSDEIRLLAFNILEQQENYIMQDINKLHRLLNTETINTELRAKFEKNLALLYWELVYRCLILPGLEDPILQKALSYTLSALKTLKTDATLWAILGKIYERFGELTKAEEAFDIANSFEIPSSQVAPYLAEIKYKSHDYIAVQDCLNSNTLLSIPLIASVKRFWDKT